MPALSRGFQSSAPKSLKLQPEANVEVALPPSPRLAAPLPEALMPDGHRGPWRWAAASPAVSFVGLRGRQVLPASGCVGQGSAAARRRKGGVVLPGMDWQRRSKGIASVCLARAANARAGVGGRRLIASLSMCVAGVCRESESSTSRSTDGTPTRAADPPLRPTLSTSRSAALWSWTRSSRCPRRSAGWRGRVVG